MSAIVRPPPYSINSVDKALQLVLLLGSQRDRWFRLSEVAEELGVARSTAHRLLAMLVYHEFARRNEDKLYGAGPVAAERLLNPDRPDLRDVAHPHLARLSEHFGETVHLVTLEGSLVLFLESVEGSQALKIGSRAGMRLPAHLSSGGKSMLATMPVREVETLMTGVDVDLGQLQALLAGVRRRGYALNLGEAERGIHAVGAAVVDRRGAIGAISLSLPSLRLPRRRIAELGQAVSETAAAISEELES